MLRGRRRRRGAVLLLLLASVLAPLVLYGGSPVSVATLPDSTGALPVPSPPWPLSPRVWFPQCGEVPCLIRAVLLFLAAASAAFDREEDAPNLVAASLAKGEFSAPHPPFPVSIRVFLAKRILAFWLFFWIV
jgi:hypothetical protein